MKLRVGVTGFGSLTSLGQGAPSLSKALRNGRTGISFNDPPKTLTFNEAKVGALLKNFSGENIVHEFKQLPAKLHERAKKLIKRQPLTFQASIIAALEAWSHAGGFSEPWEKNRIGIIVGGSNISQNFQYQSFVTFQKEPYFLSPNYAIQYMDTNHVGLLSELFQTEGFGFTVGGASASGNMALIQGYRQIQYGQADSVIVIGALSELSPVELQGFYQVRALGGKERFEHPEKVCRPFDQNRDGFVYGQGCGCIILENLEFAQKRGVTILGEICGAGIVLDKNHLSNPSAEGEAKAMKNAIQEALIKPEDIQYINTHGTSSIIGDEVEISAIKDVFGNEVSKIWINSTKSLTGHCLSAAGVLEAIATLIQLNENFIHPNLNLENPMDFICRFAGRDSIDAVFDAALSNSFGFGGINTSILIKRSPL